MQSVALLLTAWGVIVVTTGVPWMCFLFAKSTYDAKAWCVIAWMGMVGLMAYVAVSRVVNTYSEPAAMVAWMMSAFVFIVEPMLAWSRPDVESGRHEQHSDSMDQSISTILGSTGGRRRYPWRYALLGGLGCPTLALAIARLLLP